MNQQEIKDRLTNLENPLPEPKAIALVEFGKYLAKKLPVISSEQDFKLAYKMTLLEICEKEEAVPEIFQANYPSLIGQLNLLYPKIVEIVFK